MEYRKCFVPTCRNNSYNSPNKIFVRIREDLREKWCRDAGVEYCKVYTMYCCEDHFEPKTDLMNYYQHKLTNQEPRLKPTASLCFNTPNKSEDSTELTKLLLHHATTRKPVKRKYEDSVMPSTSSYCTIPVKVCRVCLAMDVKMYDLKNIELREMFQNITGITITQNNHSILERLCWECAGRLKAAAAFRHKALLSDALLQRLASTGEQIRKNDITLIKENKDYLKSAGTLSVIEVFHTVDIGPENDSITPLSENNDTEIVQNIVREDSFTVKEETIIDEENDETDVKDESMIEAPIKIETEYDPFDHICPPNTGEESSNAFIETNPLVSNYVNLGDDKINSADSSPLPGCSHAEPEHPIFGYLKEKPIDCDDKITKNVIVTTNSISKIVPKDLKELISAKSKNINAKIGGVSKKTSNKKLVKKNRS